MYDYHNGLTSPHPASSPWWAFPFDLKPVWFYQEGFAGATSAAIYDSGNLVIWWLGIAAMVFVSIMAYRRRSLGARADRDRLRGAVGALGAHRPRRLPVPLLHGAAVPGPRPGLPRRRAVARAVAAHVAVVRVAAAAALIVAPAVDVAVLPAAVRARGRHDRQSGLAGVSGGHPRLRPDRPDAWPAGLWSVVGAVVLSAVALPGLAAAASRGLGEVPVEPAAARRRRVAVAFGIGVASPAARRPRSLTWRGIPVEPIALLVLLPLLLPRRPGARGARRPPVRRSGIGVAVAAWFVVWYPNLSALPLPSTVVNAFQGLLPTYLYAFQFPVNTAARPADAAGQPDPGRTDARHRGDLPGRRLLGLGLAARAGRVAGERRLQARGRPGRVTVTASEGGGRPGSDRRGRLRDLGAEPRRAASRRPPAGG